LQALKPTWLAEFTYENHTRIVHTTVATLKPNNVNAEANWANIYNLLTPQRPACWALTSSIARYVVLHSAVSANVQTVQQRHSVDCAGSKPLVTAHAVQPGVGGGLP